MRLFLAILISILISGSVIICIASIFVNSLYKTPQEEEAEMQEQAKFLYEQAKKKEERKKYKIFF